MNFINNRRCMRAVACAAAVFFGFMALPVQAYVGPGAGFAFLGSFMALFIALLAGIGTMLIWPVRFVIRSFRRRKALSRSSLKRMVILGLDGLDPVLADQWIAEGQLPNLKKLSEQGSYSRLRTTYPSISPVAWSSFMTGVDPSRHNIFDFLNRDVRTYKPKLSSSEVSPSARTMQVGDWIIPVGKPLVRNMRKSRAFWNILGDHGIPANILRVPLTFPPEKFAGALLSAMCVPDLRGTQGSFTYYTTSPAEAGEMHGEDAVEATGGERRLVTLENGEINTVLPGPDNSMRKEGGPVEIPFSLKLDTDKHEGMLKILGKSYRLKEREYSPWIKLVFKPAPGVKVFGIARFYITKMTPDLGLYVTPINIDPGKPALPISWPSYYSVYLQKLIGDFATLGLAEDTWALNERVIDEEAFLKQTLELHNEREAMFFNALKKSREGVVACVFDGTDRLQHMFFRYLDDKHPANKGKDIEKYKNTILNMYKQADEMVGRIMDMLEPGEHFMVISDHGFSSFRRGININTWLRDNGLLFLKDDSGLSADWFENVDWTRTKAYAFGLGGIYINKEGREGKGIVGQGEESEAVKRTIIEGLHGLRDEENDDIAINDIFDNAKVNPNGPYRDNGPDLIVGYNRGYRASWEGAVGRVSKTVMIDNTKSWSGDHCIDPRLVPGVLFSNRRIDAEDPAIGDLAPTILTQFGVDVPDHMTGKVLTVNDAANTATPTAA
jgi:predicted AlkP superfamily phosphohydrolase/phosphomutase